MTTTLRPGMALGALALILAGCSHPLPPEKSGYVGEWRGQGTHLTITQDGRVSYTHTSGNSNIRISAPVKSFEGANFIVGVGPIATTFLVSEPPHQDGSAWKMTVDDVELTRSAR